MAPGGLAAALLFFLLAVIGIQTPLASPIVWYTAALREKYGLSPTDPGCVSHPSTSVASAPHHGTPIEDRGITFAFTDPANGDAPVAALCPGGTYALTVSFGASRRLALLSSDPPLATFTSPTPPVAACPNRVDLGGSNKAAAATNYTATFTVQCAAAGTSLLFKVTSSGSDARQWHQANVSIAVAAGPGPAADAPPGTCTAAALAAVCAVPPSPPPAPPPPPPPVCVGSTLGYQCMTQMGNVTVHYSINTTAAPDNPCTPATKTVMQASDVAQYGTLHVAVEAAVSGYVSLGFTPTPGKMVPADIILGYVSSSSSGGGGGGGQQDSGSPVALVNTFNVTTFARLNASSNNTAASWAYDRGVVEDAATGFTTLCFSRRLADERAVSTPDLRAASAARLGLNWAVSSQDAVVRHQRGSVGGSWVDIPKVLRAPDGSDVDKSVREEEEGGEEDKTAATTSPPPPPPAAVDASASSKGGCTPSPLGYDCMVQKGKVTLHWSVNTPSAPGGNGCTPATPQVLQDSELAQNGALHVAVQAVSPGYVALGFNPTPEEMHPADIILGWAAARPYLQTFYVTSSYLDEGNANPPPGAPSWAYDTGVTRDASTGVTTLCFSRRLADSRAPASADLRGVVVGGPAGTNTPATTTTTNATTTSSSTGGRRRLLASSSSSSSTGTSSSSSTSPLGLIWALSPAQALAPHTGDDVGGFRLDLSTGAAEEAERSSPYWINVHGALMAVAWGLLLPLGTLFPAHRWLFGGARLFGKDLWFVAHAACQWSGVALFIAGFVVAFLEVGDPVITPEGAAEVASAHETIAIAIMAAAGAQVVFAYARPAPDHPKRRLWNLIHHNLGRATVLLAWANVYTGIYAFHHSQFGASYVQWITPIAIVMGLLVILDVALRFMAPPAKPPPAKQVDYGDGGGGTGGGVGGEEGPGGVAAHVGTTAAYRGA